MLLWSVRSSSRSPLRMRLSSRFSRSFSVIALLGHLVAQVGDDGVAHEQLERQLMDLRAAAHVVLRRVDVAAGVQAHMHAAHDLARAARRVVLLEDLHLELHVLLESRGRAHRVVLGVEFEADVDDGLVGKRHGASLVHGAATIGSMMPRNFVEGKHDAASPPPIAAPRRFRRRPLGRAGTARACASLSRRIPSPWWCRSRRAARMDTLARHRCARACRRALGQPVVIENVTGASGSDRGRPRRACGARRLHARLRRDRHARRQRRDDDAAATTWLAISSRSR